MDKLRVGILGLRRGLTHLGNFLRLEDAVVIGCADRIEHWRERALETVAPHTVPVVKEYEELLAMRPDAVVVASNARCQAAHAVQALEAGCHVLSEVPGAFRQREIESIVAAVQRTGRQYMLGENSCFMDFLRYWHKWIGEERFGPISIAEAEYLHYLPGTMVDDGGNILSPSRVKEQNIQGVRPSWRADMPPIHYLTHDLGPLLNVLDDTVVSVTCRSGPSWSEEAPLRSDGQIALFETARGALIKIMVTLNTRRPGAHNYRLFGTLGSAEWYSHEGFCRRLGRDREEKQGWERVDIGTAAADDDKTAGHGGTDFKTAHYFTRALVRGKTVPIDVYRMSEFTLPGIMANQSAQRGGEPVRIHQLRPGPFEGTDFWEHVGLPETEPEGRDYVSDLAQTY